MRRQTFPSSVTVFFFCASVKILTIEVIVICHISWRRGVKYAFLSQRALKNTYCVRGQIYYYHLFILHIMWEITQ